MPWQNNYGKFKAIALLGVLLILVSCNNDRQQLVAMVGNVPLTTSEFQTRFNVNSIFPAQVPISKQKELVLSSLLAEKLLASYIDQDSLSDAIRVARDQTWRENIIEELRLDSVERKIKISERQLKREYEKSLKDIQIKYLAFNDSTAAWQFYREASSPSGSFTKVARSYLNQLGYLTEPIPQRIIVWGKEPAGFENEVYSMVDGQIGTPIFVYGQYYVILQEASLEHVRPATADYQTSVPALRDKLYRESSAKKYKSFYTRRIRPLLGKISWDHLQPIYDDLVAKARFENKEQDQAIMRPLDKEYFLNRRERYAAWLETEALRFTNNKTVPVEKVLECLAFGPYVFDYKNARAFKKSFFNMVHLMFEHQAIYNLALDKGYDHNPNVNNKMTQWDSYYRATEKKYDLLVDSDRAQDQNKLDRFLIEKSSHLEIKLYPEVLNNIELNPVGILVRKAHFANRLTAAPVQNFMGLPAWEKYVKALLVAAQS